MTLTIGMSVGMSMTAAMAVTLTATMAMALDLPATLAVVRSANTRVSKRCSGDGESDAADDGDD